MLEMQQMNAKEEPLELTQPYICLVYKLISGWKVLITFLCIKGPLLGKSIMVLGYSSEVRGQYAPTIMHRALLTGQEVVSAFIIVF